MKLHAIFSESELKKIREIHWATSSFQTTFADNNKRSLPSISEFVELLNGSYQSNDWTLGKGTSITASRISNDGVVEDLRNVPVHNAGKLFTSGYTLCFGDVSAFTPQLECLKNDAISYFGGDDKVLITCYLSPPKSAGVLHYDRQHNFFIQSDGVKKWTVSESEAVKSPYDNFVYPGATTEFFNLMKRQGYKIKKPYECGKKRHELQPSEILYVPPGFYHVAETGDKPSLHFTLTVEPLSFWSEINPHIFRTLLSSRQDMNKDIRMLSSVEAKLHIEACIRELKDSLSEDLVNEILSISGNTILEG